MAGPARAATPPTPAPPHPLVEEWDVGLRSADPLGFPGYADTIAGLGAESVTTGRTERYVVVEGRFDVLGGSMGAAAGEKVVRAVRRAVALRLPLVVRTRSGGARMQEGMVSLVQMARAAAAMRDHDAAGLLSVGVYDHPTTGGVFASYGSLVDVRAASPGATVGFAGPRVVEQILGIRLDEGSHTAESAHAAGLVDELVEPARHASWIDAVLGVARWAVPPPRALTSGARPPDATDAPGAGAWAEVERARAGDRPTGIDRALTLAASWVELRGSDPVVRAGLAEVAGRACVVVATDRHAVDGRPTPGGYDLARRAFELAAKLGRPVVTFVDTPGAHPGPDSERSGIAAAIATTFAAMDALPVPSVAVCVGEGGSGGALALAAADRLLVQEHAVFSVIAPEGAAAILLRDQRRAPELAERLRLTATDLLELGVVDGIVPEPGGAADDVALDDAVARALEALDHEGPGNRRRRPDAATARWTLDG